MGNSQGTRLASYLCLVPSHATVIRVHVPLHYFIPVGALLHLHRTKPTVGPGPRESASKLIDDQPSEFSFATQRDSPARSNTRVLLLSALPFLQPPESCRALALPH